MDEQQPEILRAVEHEVTALLRRGRVISWEIARGVHPDLEPNAYGLLLWLRRCDSIRLTDLAARLGIGKGTLSRQIQGLEGLGLVRRDPDPTDRRASLLRLTEEGQHRFDAARSARLGQFREKLDNWSERDVTEFAKLLRRFNEGLG
ncbi:MarR family transcriptional regulator [Micromonospora sp. NPDC047548]|uniref:MarR family winged helix-turn-helix transcriptional regulator n=1 Tax=Micromonospora sp. NPDC047548 TaxID=3155624 RepID=UPI0033FE1A25